MKKKAALFFVFLTNIILLGHAIVPHHHPEQPSFALQSTCTEHDKDHHEPYSDFDHDHDHGNKPDTENCVLNQVVGIPSNMLRQAFFSKSQLQHSDASYEWGYLCYDNQCLQTLCEISSHFRPPLLSFTYANYASAVLGLRAPPTR